VESGETPEAALARELEEELAMSGAIGEEIQRYEYSYPGKPAIELIFFRVTSFTGESKISSFTSSDGRRPAAYGSSTSSRATRPSSARSVREFALIFQQSKGHRSLYCLYADCNQVGGAGAETSSWPAWDRSRRSRTCFSGPWPTAPKF